MSSRLLRFFIIVQSCFASSVFGGNEGGAKKVVGYYAAWKSSQLTPSSVWYSHLTHINVAFVEPQSNGSILASAGMPFPGLVTSAHASGVKVLISVGGAGSGPAFASATATMQLRQVLINNLVLYLQTHSYDGVDIDWETPVGRFETIQATSLIQEMRVAFDLVDPSWLITMAVPPTNYGGQHFDFTNLMSSVDWFNVMCYDFYGSWAGYAGHDSPLYQSPADPIMSGSDSSAVVYMASRGVPPEKLTLGIPFYGIRFQSHGLYLPLSSTSISNPLYADAVSFQGSGWTYHWDDVAKVPYLLDSDSTEFITFEDTVSIKLKSEFSIRQNLAGVMIWELSQGLAAGGDQPLLRSIHEVFVQPTSVASNRMLPASFALADNFPNPFNGQTTIRYSIAKDSPVAIEVFDVLGRRVAVLAEGVQPAGSRRIVFDASAYGATSGLYLCRLVVEGNTQWKKMILVK